MLGFESARKKEEEERDDFEVKRKYDL